ncbi:MAG: oligosaccharide flippase family protein [Pseudomonadota bacterium]
MTLKEIFKDIFQLLFNNVFQITYGILTGIIIARTLGPEQMGAYAMAITLVITTAQLGSFQMQTSNMVLAAKNRELIGYLIANSLVHALSVSVFIVIIMLLIKNYFPHLNPLTPTMLWLCMATIPFSLAATILKGILLGLKCIPLVIRIEITAKLMAASLLVAGLFLKMITAQAALALYLFATSVIFCSFLWSLLAQVKKTPQFSFHHFHHSLSRSTRLFLFNGLTQLLDFFDLYTVQLLLGATLTGFYSLGQGVQNLILVLPLAIEKALIPRLSARESRMNSWQLTKFFAMAFAGVGAILIVLEFFFLGPLINFIYGDKFLPATQIVFMLSIAALLSGIANTFLCHLLPKKIPNMFILLWGFIILAKILFSWMTLQRWGVFMAAGSTLTAQMILLSMTVFYASRKR